MDLSVIYITHDLSTVKYFSERIFVMYAGNLIEKADTRRLLENPLHPYTHALLAAHPSRMRTTRRPSRKCRPVNRRAW